MSAAMRRGFVLAALAIVAIGSAALIFGGKDDSYTLYAKFRQAGGLRQGFKVRIDGAPVGKIAKLTLDKQDLVVAKLSIDKSAAPVGMNVRATARAADLLGEKFVDLDPGDKRKAAPSGTTIPPSRTGLAVELDDVINALDLPTRQALRVFLNEQGKWFVGRGQDLGVTLQALPGAIDRTRALLQDLGADNVTLGRLVDESDRVVASVAGQRGKLGRLVGAAGETFTTLGNRDAELAASVREAPATLASTRRALAALERAAVPLGPAARGLRDTAPQLTATLKELPKFTKAAHPALQTVRRVSPTLRHLGQSATPVVKRLRPLSAELADFGNAFEPATQVLDNGVADLLGVLEGWARATQGKDKASHVFRFGLTIGPETIPLLATLLDRLQNPVPPKGKSKDATPARTPATPQAGAQKPPLALPKLPEVKLPKLIQNVPKVLQTVTDALGLTGDKSQPKDGRQLLDYLLKP